MTSNQKYTVYIENSSGMDSFVHGQQTFVVE